MNEKSLMIYQLGMSAQLAELTIDEMILYVRNHIHNFLFDESVCFCFIERFANDPETGKSEEASKTLLYLLDKALQYRPFRPGLLKAVVNLTRNPQAEQRLKTIEELNESKETYDLISALDLKQEALDAQKYIEQLIQVHPNHMAAAQFALSVDRHLGIAKGNWQKNFVCPPALRRDWEIALFNHYAAMCAYDEAMPLWTSLHKDMLRETALNNAAEMFIAMGDVEQGLGLYKSSLAQDPRQTPIHLRVKELENPFKPDMQLLNSCSVNICLYSWNKAEILDQTLKSLSETDIGSARIDILLNGCTDDSREIVDNALALFPDNEVTIHDLHVNIGAPAARNWLMNLPEVQKSKYIAFLDDDVTVQSDWLASFLTVAESDEKIGVVGCKIVHPGEPAQIQYLFRYVAIANHGLLKMSIHSPLGCFDTHVYDFIRETRNVMGCQHLLRTKALRNIPAGFDIRFSPSQVDDIDHDIAVCLEGYKVMYCGTVTCIHHQSSGINIKSQVLNAASSGSTMANDMKFYFKHFDHMGKLEALDNLSLSIGVEPPVI